MSNDLAAEVDRLDILATERRERITDLERRLRAADERAKQAEARAAEDAISIGLLLDLVLDPRCDWCHGLIQEADLVTLHRECV